MKSTILTELPLVPEQFDSNMLDMVDWSKIQSFMGSGERAFINGLIRYYHPEHVLELGVYYGGGTVNVLNALRDFPNSTLTSIELCEYFGDVPAGNEVGKAFPELPVDKWELFAGKDASEIIDSLGKTFDFAIIDTAHVHPIESLNFLCVLPYMNDGAIVVLHDTSYFLSSGNEFLAARILLSTVAAQKIEGNDGHHFVLDWPNNIAAFQITSDTRKYIGNIFDALLLPWGTYPDNFILSVRKLLEKHYPVGLLNKFDTASKLNEAYVKSDGRTYDPVIMKTMGVIKHLPANTVFYGAGTRMKYLLDSLDKANITFNFSIWDKNRTICEINGRPVTAPDFKTQVCHGTAAVIMIDDDYIFEEVCACMKSLGYTVFHGARGLLQMQN